ncbi:hypothetical protein BKN14_00625 [Candidatus Gracilibacteria bacterium HOT-871]|nr:hypothetical protein BKN14_00625 [Candidatus Gracilibacteria bacterium HOT-871]
MELFIHLGTNLEYFDLLNSGNLLSKGKDDRELVGFFMQNFPGELAETISPQYEVNFMAIREIKKRFGQDYFNKISGIYYGSDNCEFLVPMRKEIEKAVEKFVEFNKNFPPHKIRTFTFVTPYVGDKMMERLEESLAFLNDLKIKNSIEIVVNDYGVLSLINRKFPNLKIIFGRLIHKILKTPLVDTFGYEAHPAGELIKNKSEQEKQKLRDQIVKWQMRFYNSAEVSLEIYRKFLEKYKIERITLDYMEKRGDLFDNDRFNNFSVDLYYPWALVFTGRLCDTSAIENPSKGFYATDEVCPRTCNRYDIFYKIKTVGYHMIQRGNSGYRSELNLDFLKEDFVKNEKNRLVFAPFITV